MPVRYQSLYLFHTPTDGSEIRYSDYKAIDTCFGSESIIPGTRGCLVGEAVFFKNLIFVFYIVIKSGEVRCKSFNSRVWSTEIKLNISLNSYFFISGCIYGNNIELFLRNGETSIYNIKFDGVKIVENQNLYSGSTIVTQPRAINFFDYPVVIWGELDGFKSYDYKKKL